ncbi:MAG: DUF362 domain-containing protein [Proteobacteria bacterium]|nr:DUF362 domain-containing protein [Pseudomonadota bacterium]
MYQDRRTFLRTVGLLLMGISLPRLSSGFELRVPTPQFSDKNELVVVKAVHRGASDDEIIASVRNVAEGATDFSWLSRGDTVLIKPAANSPRPYPATTSPLSIRGLVSLLEEKGAGKVIVADKSGVQYVYHDGKGQRGSSRNVMTENGLHQAALESGAELHYFDEKSYDDYFGDRPEHNNHWSGELILPNILNQVDHVVLLPRVSRHVLAGTTLGLKAAVGWLRDDSRLELHRDAKSFFQKIAEINDAKVLMQKLRLVLTVATKVQTTFGPDHGFATEPDPGLVFGSASLLAHDMVSLGWLLWNRQHATPQNQIAWYRDPFMTYPGIINRLFVGRAWGIRQLFKSETYSSVPITSVRTDPVISQAAAIWGGVPELKLESVGAKLDENIAAYLIGKAAA